MKIEKTQPTEPSVAELLRASHRLMAALFRPEDNFQLDLDALAAPCMTLWAACDGGQILGIIALKNAAGYGEIKSLFVAEAARSKQVGARLLRHLEGAALEQGIAWLRLETGTDLTAAGQLYARAGYTRRGPFGDYLANGTSVFYEKRLIPACTTG